MKESKFNKNYNALVGENAMGRVTMAALSIIAVVTTIAYLSKEPVVVFTPPTAVDDAWVSSKSGSTDYLKSWALHLSGILGNVAPNNVGFIKDAIAPIISPSIYQEVNEALEAQAQAIEEDQVSMRFEPKYVEVEKSSGKIFVYGTSFERSAVNRSEEVKVPKTYEFIIAIENFAPHVVFIDTYSELPRNEKVLEKLAMEAERQAQRKKR